jgi:hypothetical protein
MWRRERLGGVRVMIEIIVESGRGKDGIEGEERVKVREEVGGDNRIKGGGFGERGRGG